nr:MAG TPA_asm: hypothetical protein [Caudoviricetes sp.]
MIPLLGLKAPLRATLPNIFPSRSMCSLRPQ